MAEYNETASGGILGGGSGDFTFWPKGGAVPVYRSTSGGYDDDGSAYALKPSGTMAGDFLMAFVKIEYDGSFTEYPGFTPGGWTRLDYLSEYNEANTAVYYKVAGSSEPDGYTFGASFGHEIAVIITRTSGVDTSNPFAVYGKKEAFGFYGTPPDITVPVGRGLLYLYALKFSGTGNNVGYWSNTSPTNTDNGSLHHRVGYDTLDSAGSLGSYSINSGFTGGWMTWAIVLQGPPPETYDEDGSGGIVCGGIAHVGVITSREIAGGIVAGGSSHVSVPYTELATGGVISAGEAWAVTLVGIYGGMAAGGTSLNTLIAQHQGSGGVVANGVAFLTSVQTVPSLGGVVIGGLSPNTIFAMGLASGGVVIGGTGENDVNQAFRASGGVVCGGVALLGGSDYVFTSGGVVAGGSAIVDGIDNYYRTQIVVPASQIAEDLEKFPLALSLKLNDISNIMVTDSSDNVLPHAVRSFDNEAELVHLFVKVNLSASVDNTFYVTYGNAGEI